MDTDTNALETFTVTRDGLPPIKFTGTLIGHGSTRTVSGSNQNRWTEAAIYRTRGGKYVVSLERHTQWQGERDHYSAASCATAHDAVAWLREGAGALGIASEEAVLKAVKVDEGFQSVWVEEVE